MALKQLMLAKKIEQRKSALEELISKEDGFKTRSDELEQSINEAKSEEEVSAVEAEIEKLENEKQAMSDEKSNLEKEIADIEKEIEELNQNTPQNNNGGQRKMNNNLEVRESINSYVRTKGQTRDGFTSVEGGALIPEDLMAPKKELVDALDLSQYVRNLPVTRGSGKYPIIKKSNGKFTSVAELAKNPKLATPTFDEVTYDIETYRGYVPVSQEAIDDADYDIAGLIAEDIQDQERNTKNEQIAAILKTAPAKEVTGLDGIVTMFNKDFKKVYNTKAFVSSSLFNALDLLKDKNGRYLLEDDITVASGKRIKGKEIVVLDDDVIGEEDGDLVGFFGDAYEFITLFNRKQASVKWVDNDIYGQLLAGFVRFDVKSVDDAAGYYVTYTEVEDEEEVPEV